MLFGLVLAAIPATIGTSQAISEQRRRNAEAKQTEKFNLIAVECASMQERDVVLKDGKLYLDHPAHPVAGHRFRGFYINYPCDKPHLGLVSTIADDPPILNWIYAEREDMSLRYGNRTESIAHVTGPWSWTANEEFSTLDEDGRFVAVESDDGSWVVHFNPNGDQSGIPQGRRTIQLWLRRRLVSKVEDSLKG